VAAAGVVRDGEKDEGRYGERRRERQREKDVAVLMRAAVEMQVHASEAERLIPMREVLEKDYTDAARVLREGQVVGGVGTRPAAAVKMGVLFLKTWAERMEAEGKEVGWTPLLELGECGDL